MEISDSLTRTNLLPVKFRSRRGFAPVEMTLVLPLFMLMMAAIMAFGFNACWKIRTEIVARDVTWRNRYPHQAEGNANRDAQNPEWTSEAEDGGRNEIVYTRTSSGSNLSVFADEDILNAPIIRGDLPVVNVNSNLLNFARSVDRGVARIRRRPTVLPKMGLIDFETEHSFIGNLFQHGLMGISNWSRRFPRIYGSELDELNGSAAIQSALAGVQAVRDPDCLAIDEDEEFQQDPARLERRSNCRYPDYHPRISLNSWKRAKYTLDKEWVKEHIVQPLVERGVPGVPDRMIRGTISLYKRIQAEIDPANQAEIDQWQALIDELEEFRETL